MGNRSSSPPPAIHTPTEVSLPRTRSFTISSLSSEDSSEDSIIFPDAPSPLPTPPTRDEYIQNLVLEGRDCNQLGILIESHGDPTLIMDADHDDVETTINEINIRAKTEFLKEKYGIRLKTVIKEVILWDNRVAFTITDPESEEDIIFRIYNRESSIFT